MIKKNGETGKDVKSSFKRFSDINKGTKVSATEDDPSLEVIPEEEKDLPANPNLPVESTKRQKNSSTRSFKPLADKQNYDKEESNDSIDEVSEDHKVKLYGKVAKLPKGTKASKGFNFLENVKISKNSIWYIMAERDNELQMVKYNYKKGVDLNKFINELKSYYISKNKGNKIICEHISKIAIDGNDKYSMIRNIPLLELDGKKLITKITEDLIKLLSK